MKPRRQIAGSFQVQDALGDSSRRSTFLANELGRTGRPRWVLKWMGKQDGRPLRALVRPDIGDLSSLADPALALPTSFGQDPATGRAFMLRPYVPGAEILSAARGRGLKEILPWLASAAGSLSILHRSGFLHRNLKASNLIVARNALLSRPRRECMIVLCDPAWWPEEEPATAENDLHALGRIFYRLLTGEEFEPGRNGPPAPPSRLNPEVGIDLDRLILKLLHPHPRGRYQEAGSLFEDLRRLTGGRAPHAPEMPERLLQRNLELETARARLETRRPTAISVTGEAGMGKSVFLRRLAIEGQLAGYRTVLVRCFPETALPFTLLHSLARALFAGGPSFRSLRSRWRKLCGEKRPESEATVPEARSRFLRGILDLFVEAARGQPILVLVDEAHFADSLTIDFLARWIRDLPSAPPAASVGRPILSLAVSYRPEAPFRAALEPLVAASSAVGENHLKLELGPFSRKTVEELLLLSGFPAGPKRSEILSRLRGHPLLLWETIRKGGLRRGERPAVERDLDSLYQRYLDSLAPEGRSTLETLAVLGRPAPEGILSAILPLPGRRLRPSLETLLADGTLIREGQLLFFQHSFFRTWIFDRLERKKREALHGRIASSLEEHGEATEEIAEHWLRSDQPRRAAPPALAAARGLAQHHQYRRALEFYQTALDSPPSRKKSVRRKIAEEAAAIFSRAGEHRRAAEVLKALLPGCRRPRDAGRLHGRMGIFCHRGGDVPGALAHLEKGLRLLEGAPGLEWVRERVRFQAELAEISSTSGDYARCETICREALEALLRCGRARRDRQVRLGEMLLLETFAHLRLRRFQYREARLLFEQSLRAAKPLGATTERSLLLNNLGTLHAQENRFLKANDCYQEARKLSERLGDDQSLAIIHSNLAVGHSRIGDPEAADAALALAEEHDARCDSQRSKFLRIHSAGLVHLSFGRYGSAIDAFQAAIRLGEELKDLHLVAFELVFLGECRLSQGEFKSAEAAFIRAAGTPSAPRPVLSMVEARRSALDALRGKSPRERRTLPAAPPHTHREIPFVEGWNQIFRGWAHRLSSWQDQARGELEEALAFFSRVKVPSGEIQASLELAMLEGESGRTAAALDRMRALEERFACGKGALRNPMLSARLLLYHTKLLLEQNPPPMAEAAALLVEAESFLIGQRIHDLEALAADLRERIRRAEAVELRDGGKGPAPPSPGAPAERTLGVESILGCSASIRKVVEQILQVAPSPLPVLITGETGTGKELVARAIHGKSERRRSPFLAVNCAALPGELLEAQLFGFRRGAFSGAEKDHPGLLLLANGGTFLFDEIAELPIHLQAKLLRVLDGGKVRPLGGEEEIEIDVRFLCATNRDLRPLAAKGTFRRDLFFRVSAFEIAVPPLRERRDDLPLLVEHFRKLCGDGGAPLKFDEGARRALASHSWPGNVRELKNLISRLALTSSGPVGAAALRPLLIEAPAGKLFPSSLLRGRPLESLHSQLEREYLIQLHADCAGDLEAIAASLGISVRAVYDRFRRLGIALRDLR